MVEAYGAILKRLECSQKQSDVMGKRDANGQYPEQSLSEEHQIRRLT